MIRPSLIGTTFAHSLSDWLIVIDGGHDARF
jgi:hypothetical protein